MEVVRIRSTARRIADAGVSLLLPGGHGVFETLWQVDGFLFPHEGVLLYQIGRYASAGRPIVEIGSMRGLSTCCLAAGLRRAPAPARIVAIDPHLYGSEPEFRYNLRRMGAGGLVDVRVERSEDVARNWSNEISAVFIDGAHDLQSVMQDFATWSEKVRPGGFVLVHDSTSLSQFAGPAFVAESKIKVGDVFDVVGRVGSITWGRKAGDGSWRPSLAAAPLVDALIRLAKGGGSVPKG